MIQNMYVILIHYIYVTILLHKASRNLVNVIPTLYHYITVYVYHVNNNIIHIYII